MDDDRLATPLNDGTVRQGLIIACRLCCSHSMPTHRAPLRCCVCITGKTHGTPDGYRRLPLDTSSTRTSGLSTRPATSYSAPQPHSVFRSRIEIFSVVGQPKGSDAYARTAQHKILNMQRAVMHEVHSRPQGDPLGETETTIQLEHYLSVRKVQPGIITLMLSRLTNWQAALSAPTSSTTTPLAPESGATIQDDPPLDEDQMEEKVDVVVGKRKRSNSPRSQARATALGDDPREQRRILRASLAPGFCISISSKLSRRTLHKLGSCYMIPGIDDPRYVYAGPTLPEDSEFHTTCESCTTHSKLQGRANSVDSNSSSSAGEAT